MARGVGGGGGRGMSGGGGRGMSGGRGGGSAGRGSSGGMGGRGGGMGGPGGGRSGGMGGPGGGMGGPPPRRRSSGSGFGTGFLMGSLMSGGRRNRRVTDNGSPQGGGGGGCLGGMLFPTLIVIILLIVVISSCAVMNMGTDSGSVPYEGSDITRTKLADNQCSESSQWIDDELGWLSSQSTVKNAMDSFYKETGVQPYLILTDNIDGKDEELTDDEVESYLTDVYDSLYKDEGHMILLFLYYGSDQYMCYVYTGSAANGVIDSSAKDYIISLVDSYYTDYDLTNDEYFAKVFEDAGKNLMQDYNESSRTRNIIIIIVVVGVILIIVLFLIRRASEARAREAEKTKAILDTPIGESPEKEDLERKYGDNADDGSGGDTGGGSSGAGSS